jgi:sialic acid synthase SpsE
MNRFEFVAEVSSNHNKNLKRCLQFVDEASAIGCNAVKFQLFKIDELFAPEILKKSLKHRDRKQWELPISFLPEIAARCLGKKINFYCTPFYLKAVEELFPYIEAYKIASYEILWKDLLSVCAQTGKPVILSTGMATMREVDAAVKVLIDSGCRDLTLLHCVSSYPAPLSECNLSAIETLRKAFAPRNADCRVKVGWSDHSVSPAVIYRAVHRWGAEMVEFHLDLEGLGEEYRGGHCWLPSEIKKVIETLRGGFSADGHGEKIPAPSELPDREWRADPEDGLRPVRTLRETWNPK